MQRRVSIKSRKTLCHSARTWGLGCAQLSHGYLMQARMDEECWGRPGCLAAARALLSYSVRRLALLTYSTLRCSAAAPGSGGTVAEQHGPEQVVLTPLLRADLLRHVRRHAGLYDIIAICSHAGLYDIYRSTRVSAAWVQSSALAFLCTAALLRAACDLLGRSADAGSDVPGLRTMQPTGGVAVRRLPPKGRVPPARTRSPAARRTQHRHSGCLYNPRPTPPQETEVQSRDQPTWAHPRHVVLPGCMC